MLDPAVLAAFYVIVAWLLKIVLAAVGINLTDDVYMALAVQIVSLLLGWLSANVFKAFLVKRAPAWFKQGLLTS